MYSGPIEQHESDAEGPSFADLGLSDPTLRVLATIGFELPTEIQTAVMSRALAGHNIMGLAQTGSGKTAAFCIPLIERLRARRHSRALVVCPTREIALQTESFARHFAVDLPDVVAPLTPERRRRQRRGTSPGRGGSRRPRHPRHRVWRLRLACLIGGVRYGPQIDSLETNPQMVVATPGRLIDLEERGVVRLSEFDELVLDEADHMLDLGFLPQIQKILERLPSRHRTMMFSATMPPTIERLSKRYMRDFELVDLRPDGQAASGIDHRLYLVSEHDKKRCVLELLRQEEGSTLVFTRRKIDAEWLARVLEQEGHPVERIHSDRSQGHRTRALQRFRDGEHRILVATDVAARGIDIPRIAHIINFDLPETVEDYVHRSGRTARGAAGGTVSSIGTWLDKALIRRIENVLGHDLPRCEAPGVVAWQERRSPAERRRRSVLRR